MILGVNIKSRLHAMSILYPITGMIHLSESWLYGQDPAVHLHAVETIIEAPSPQWLLSHPHFCVKLRLYFKWTKPMDVLRDENSRNKQRRTGNTFLLSNYNPNVSPLLKYRVIKKYHLALIMQSFKNYLVMTWCDFIVILKNAIIFC